MTEPCAVDVEVGAETESVRRRKTRERLMDAAFRVFAEHGIHAASVEQVAEAAGFTRGAFYSNFSSKEELFVAVMDRENDLWTARIRSRVDASLATESEGELDAQRLGRIVVDVLRAESDDRDWCLVQLEATQLALRDADIARRQLESRRRTIAGIAAFVREAVERMGRRFVLDERQAIAVLAGVYDAALTEVLLERAPIEQVAERLREPLSAVLLGITEPVA